MKDKTVCFTGHREIPVQKTESLKRELRKTVEELIAQGFCYFGAGGALGFDTLAEQTVLELKQQYPQIKLILVLPCLSQANSWSEKDKQIYESIKKQADKVVYTSQAYTRGCMHIRNRYLVENSSVCVSYLTRETGGTAYTVNYAKQKKTKVINLA